MSVDRNLYYIPSSLTVHDIIHQVESDPDEVPWVRGVPKKEHIHIEAYNPQWPVLFEQLKGIVQQALGATALHIEHVGSTAVEQLPAKPVIDMDVTVADSSREELYVPALEALGYQLEVREPTWYEHRVLRLENPRVNLHVFSPDCPEAIRHILFRNWLREHTEDRERYAAIKYEAARDVENAGDYNAKKNAVVKAIYHRMFSALGLVE
ncbi:GrpB family protein [Chitinophaga varians]|uniref:GrpB family protein n=1 Tax=Chitinophaga varians TaxID=2202339 RepID=UPI00165F4348|nr:GrpB family protein [Chitinophaga varians]MBC9914407.1 GrpB family protein [Chitinophaga varians]